MLANMMEADLYMYMPKIGDSKLLKYNNHSQFYNIWAEHMFLKITHFKDQGAPKEYRC